MTLDYKFSKMKKILIINGPNLNLLGKRQPEVYGTETLQETIQKTNAAFPDVDLEYYQSNHEGAIIDKIHEVGFNHDYLGIVINPGAYAHYSYAIADAIASIELPVIEVHISNILARDEFRHKSVTAPVVKAVITGAGRDGYRLAVSHLLQLQEKREKIKEKR